MEGILDEKARHEVIIGGERFISPQVIVHHMHLWLLLIITMAYLMSDDYNFSLAGLTREL